MKNADLAQIRAQLQATAAPERRRPATPLLGALRSLLPAAADAPRPSAPIARRVGLRPAEPAEAAAEETADATAFESSTEARRRAFGQRQDVAPGPSPILMLAAPPSLPEPLLADDDAAVAEALRRRSLRLVPVQLSPAETPYLPEDLSDPAEADAERLYADSGLFETQVDAPLEPEPAPEPGPAPDPQRDLLRHLERVFLAERAALGAPAAG